MRPRRGRAGRLSVVVLACLLALASWLVLSQRGGGQTGAAAQEEAHGSGREMADAGRDADGARSLIEGTEGNSDAGTDGRRETDTGYVEQKTVEGDLPQVASGVVEGYRDQGSCVLVRSGYLDLFGEVWSCTVSGDGWVDTCLVSEGEGACVVRTVRMEADWMSLSGTAATEGS